MHVLYFVKKIVQNMTSPLPQRPSIQITANRAGSIILIDNLIKTTGCMSLLLPFMVNRTLVNTVSFIQFKVNLA